jgi:hypothetical protein
LGAEARASFPAPGCGSNPDERKLMMFETASDELANAITPFLKQNLDLFFTFYEEPPEFWRNSYVLGYHFGQISALIQALGGRRLGS